MSTAAPIAAVVAPEEVDSTPVDTAAVLVVLSSFPNANVPLIGLVPTPEVLVPVLLNTSSSHLECAKLLSPTADARWEWQKMRNIIRVINTVIHWSYY